MELKTKLDKVYNHRKIINLFFLFWQKTVSGVQDLEKTKHCSTNKAIISLNLIYKNAYLTRKASIPIGLAGRSINTRYIEHNTLQVYTAQN